MLIQLGLYILVYGKTIEKGKGMINLKTAIVALKGPPAGRGS